MTKQDFPDTFIQEKVASVMVRIRIVLLCTAWLSAFLQVTGGTQLNGLVNV